MTRVLSAGVTWALSELSMRIHTGAPSSSHRCTALTKPVSARIVDQGGAPEWALVGARVRAGEALSLRFLTPIMKVVALTRRALCPDQP
jgi:enoyl-CoA hydratase/carnithine racemase